MGNVMTLDRHAATTAAARFATRAARLAAVARRDPAADGHFFYAVKTTGVYCRPSCAARAARPENVEFHTTTGAAERAGYRACKRCRPDAPSRAEREAALVAEACRAIEAADEAPALAQLAARAGVSAHHFHRLFKRISGVTPKAYAVAQRQRRVQHSLRREAGVTEAIFAAGYNSSSRFYEKAPAMLGMTPSAYRQGGAGEVVQHATARCSLGVVLVAATERGICAILLGDDAAALTVELQARFPQASLTTPRAGFADVVEEVVRLVDDPAQAARLTLPLDIRGTAFQRRVWELLRQIPAGETKSYGEVAARLGRPHSARAVAAACAANPLAVAVPCHRVNGSDGKLRGYRWGVERKRRLQARERQ
jgi:AraC family transcriptional regulator of adaptative response/methylated-DNA-[protein]-cysteine methyltransferase